jgi:hypothetical protein
LTPFGVTLSQVPAAGAELLALLTELLELDIEEEVDETDDLLLDDELLALLTELLMLDIEEDFDETTEEEDETLLALLALDIDDDNDDNDDNDDDDAEETLVVLLEDTLDDLEDIADELLTLPVSAALDEPFTAVPPVQALIDRQVATKMAA